MLIPLLFYCIFGFIYIYIYIYKGCNGSQNSRFGSKRHSGVTVRYGGQGNWLSRNVGNISVLNHEGKPMDITQARACTRVCTRANFAQYLYWH